MKIERLDPRWAPRSPKLVACNDLLGRHSHPCTTLFKVVPLPSHILLPESCPLTSNLLHHPLLASQPRILLDLRGHYPLRQLNLLFLAGVHQYVMIESPTLRLIFTDVFFCVLDEG